MASLTELSFNWLGFISAMISNISFTYRSIYSKKAMVKCFFTRFPCVDSIKIDDKVGQCLLKNIVFISI